MHNEIHIVSDLALILISAGIITLIFRRLKQPLVLGYIVAGFLISPYFKLFPSVIARESLQEWSEIGIIFLLFALGLEFSFRKLMHVGGQAFITALTEVIAMMSIGFLTGYLLGWSTAESIFLGGMLSMSSTTIIIKAFDDLGLRNRKFTAIVFGTLIVEDLVAILMMVMLSTVAVSRRFAGTEMMVSFLRLGFFLVLCFVVGIYILPTFFRYARRWMNEETLLIISLGLCFGLVVLATHLGFSAALGAFLMGSILAETIESARIEHLIKQLKDLFGAVFFVSVGMMVDPAAMLQYALPIVLLTLLTLFGKSLFSSLGVLLSGQSLRVAIQSGFSLAQIGEFAFIIASLGYTLGVIREFIYPVIVTISVITTFTTPYFIRLADPFCEWLNPRIPLRIKLFLENYSAGGDIVKEESDWRQMLSYYAMRILAYSVIIIALILLSHRLLYPFTLDKLSALPPILLNLLNALITLLLMAPFLTGLMVTGRSRRKTVARLYASRNRINGRRLTALTLCRIFLATFWVTLVLFINFQTTAWPVIFIALSIIIFLYYARQSFRAHWRMEDRFLHNLNQKEEYERRKTPLRSALDTFRLSNRDIHLVNLTLSPDSPFVGRTLRELDIRKNYGINIVKITRGQKEIYFPAGETHLYPTDLLLAIGTDSQLATFTRTIETHTPPADTSGHDKLHITLSSFLVEKNSYFLGKTVATSGLRDIGSIIVGVDRGKQSIVNPDHTLRFSEGDLIWIAGDREKILRLLSGQPPCGNGELRVES
jgi:CPA2 family monovalent cation:H+ antiporter-2